jgi:sortase A
VPSRWRLTGRRLVATLLYLELALWLAAVVGLSVWAAATLSAKLDARNAIEHFNNVAAVARGSALPDQHLWSPVRVRAWQESLTRDAAPLGVLRIPRLAIEAPVLEGTDDWTLNRGIGHIADTAAVGARGNSGLAGHRDGFFRALKDVAPGDRIELETLDGVRTYLVERTWIVSPEDVSVLDPVDARAITLVTCYPFYFVGSAPQRFIVRAVEQNVN